MPPIDINDTVAIHRRITELQRGEYQERSFFEETYGFTLEALDRLLRVVTQWDKRMGRERATRGAEISRFVLEKFLTAYSLLAPACAAARIGVDAASFGRIVQYARDELGIPIEAIGAPDAAYREDFVMRLHQSFPALRSRVFSSHTSYCKAIHAAFQAEDVAVTPVYDPVAVQIGEKDPDLSHDLDIVTCSPIGLRFTVWLGFGKPFALEPDKTSALTYLRYRTELQGLVPDYFTVDEEQLKQINARASKAA